MPQDCHDLGYACLNIEFQSNVGTVFFNDREVCTASRNKVPDLLYARRRGQALRRLLLPRRFDGDERL